MKVYNDSNVLTSKIKNKEVGNNLYVRNKRTVLNIVNIKAKQVRTKNIICKTVSARVYKFTSLREKAKY